MNLIKKGKNSNNLKIKTILFLVFNIYVFIVLPACCVTTDQHQRTMTCEYFYQLLKFLLKMPQFNI